MIAGTPTSAGTIVDVEEQAGNYLIAVQKAELAVEFCEAPIASTESVDFSQMTKAQLEAYGRSLGLELDKRQTKTDLIKKLEEFISTQKES